MNNLSVVLATRNEEANIARCLNSIKEIADEIIIVDEYSTDKTVEIAKKFGAKIYKAKHEENFHITKQKALDHASGNWILQLDADETVSPKLALEISEVICASDNELKKLRLEVLENRLFKRHQDLIEERDGPIGKKTGEIVAFFIPRVNFFLGKPLIYAGGYPDGVIRLVKRSKASFPQKSVHEQMDIDGEVSWLRNNLEHNDSPTLSKYFKRLNRYTDLQAEEFREINAPKNFFSTTYYSIFKPSVVFLSLFIRHKGILDGTRGFLWSLFSAMHYPIAYFKYRTGV